MRWSLLLPVMFVVLFGTAIHAQQFGVKVDGRKSVKSTEDGGAAPQWLTSDGRKTTGTPIKSSYNKETKKMEYAFHQDDGTEVRVLCEEFDEKTRKSIGDELRLRRSEEVRRNSAIEEEKRERRQEEQKASQEAQETAWKSREFTLSTGDTITGAQIDAYNDSVRKAESRYLLELNDSEVSQYRMAIGLYKLVGERAIMGDRIGMIGAMKQLGPDARKEISRILGSTPIGEALANCDGKALTLNEIWTEACGVAGNEVIRSQ